ncbi:hypothetical protein BS78_02G078500 [Paspalum vaginatum]|nr:hypothetical protein BS78_02G078500 [Paspalum vaginatum]
MAAKLMSTMSAPRPPLPRPLPGASPHPHSPTPVLCPDPAATLKAARIPRVATPPLEAPEPFVSPSLVPAGRSKTVRWRDCSPSSPDEVDPRPTTAPYRDALLSAARVDLPPTLAPAQPSQADLGSGWQVYESWRARQRRRRPPLCPRRSVPEDLQGKCFNYLSKSHRAAGCLCRPQCFRCLEEGHRAAACPGRRAPVRRLEWRPVTDQGGTCGMAKPTGAGGAGRSCRRRRRPRSRRRRASRSPPPSASGSMEDGSDSSEAPLADGVPIRKPQRFLASSSGVEDMEMGLRCALIITCIGGSETIPRESVSALLARRFGLAEGPLVLRRVSATEFILFLADEATAVRVFDGGKPVISPSLQLHVARWTRFFRSSGAALCHEVDVEIRGIPVHAWDVGTATLLLDEFCLVSEVEADALDRRDALRLRAWSSQPGLIPRAMDLLIKEPHAPLYPTGGPSASTVVGD